MNKKVSGIIIGSLLLIPALSLAAVNQKPVSKWSCEDFLTLDSSFQPTAVGFAEILNNKNKPEDTILDVKGIDTVTPAVVRTCKETPKASFKSKVESEWDKLKKHI